jgi:uncharacterized Zn-finger protein
VTADNNIKPPEVITVENDADEVVCDGGNGALGHPVVWYSFDGQDMVECKYCDRRFVKKRSAKKYGG